MVQLAIHNTSLSWKPKLYVYWDLPLSDPLNIFWLCELMWQVLMEHDLSQMYRFLGHKQAHGFFGTARDEVWLESCPRLFIAHLQLE